MAKERASLGGIGADLVQNAQKNADKIVAAKNEPAQEPTQQPAGIALSKPKKEAKSKRVNLLLQPSLYEKAQALAADNGISFNEMISQVLEQMVGEK